MKLRRLLSLTGFLTAILMFTGGSLYAADLIRVGSAQAFAGGNDTVSVYVTTDEAYNAVEITLGYDPAKLSYEEGSIVVNPDAWNPAWGDPDVLPDDDNGTLRVSFASLTILDAAVPKSAVALKLFSVVLNVAEGIATGTETVTPTSGLFVSMVEGDPVENDVTNLTAGTFTIQTAFTLSVEENVEASPGYDTPVNIYLTNGKDAVGVEFTLTFDSDQIEYAESVEVNQEAWQGGAPQPAEVTPTAGQVKVVIYTLLPTAKIPVSNDQRWIAKVYLKTADGAAETAVNALELPEGMVVTVDEDQEFIDNTPDLIDGNFEILAKQSLKVSTDAAAPQGGSDEVTVYLKNSETAVAVEAVLTFDADQFTVEESDVVFNKAIFTGSEAGVTVTLLITESTVSVVALPGAQDSIPGSDVENELFTVTLNVNEDATPDSYDLDISGLLTVRDEDYETEELEITSVTPGAFIVRSPLELQVQSLTALPLTKQTVDVLLTNRDEVIGGELVIGFDALEVAYVEGSLVFNSEIWSSGLPTVDVEAGDESVAVSFYDLTGQTTVAAGGSGQVLLSLDFTLSSVLAVDDTSWIDVEGMAAVTNPDDPTDPLEQDATGITGYIAVAEEVEPTEPEDVTYLKVMPVVAAAGGAANATSIMLNSVDTDVAGVGFKFLFDQTKLQLTAVAEGAGIAGLALAEPVDLVAANAAGEFVVAATGLDDLIAAGAEAELLTVTIAVLEGTATGQVPLTLEEASLSDVDGEAIALTTVTNGYVSVVEPTGADLDGNSVVDARDLWYYLNNPMMVLFEDLAACIATLMAQPLPSTMLASAQDAVYTAGAADGAALINLNTDFEIIAARFTFSYDNSFGVADVQLSQALTGKVFIKQMLVEGKLVVDIISLTGLVPAELGSEMFSVAFRDATQQEAGLTLEKVEVADRSGKVYIEAAKVNGAKALPKAFTLSQNSPNPFNPSTTISYEIPESSGAAKVVVAVYNIRGQKVVTLVDELKETGQYSVNWDGLDETGRRVSSGVYFYRMNAGDFTAVRKMVVLK